MPKAKISEEMIVDAALQVAREEGENSINARTVSERLHCSTQPVLYYFDSIEDVRRAAFHRAEKMHMAYIMNGKGEYENPLLEIAVRYIRFAEEEKHLFRFLFQTNRFANHDLKDWGKDVKIRPIVAEIAQQTGLDEQKAQEFFLNVYLTMHGYASMLANNVMEYNEVDVTNTLRRTIRGQMMILGGFHESNHT